MRMRRWAIVKYNTTPKISMIVVMNGAETSAGSSRNNRKTKGKAPPAIVASIEIASKVLLTTIATVMSRPRK